MGIFASFATETLLSETFRHLATYNCILDVPESNAGLFFNSYACPRSATSNARAACGEGFARPSLGFAFVKVAYILTTFPYF